MAKTSNIIELNGKKYNALTGALLDVYAQPSSYASHVKPLAVQPRPHHGSVDGIFGGVRSGQHLKAVKKSPTTIRAVKQITHHQPQHSKTLMRHAVKAPIIKQKTSMKTVTPLQKTLPTKLAVQPKLSSEVIDGNRTKRALGAPRSHMVRRFNTINRPQTTPAIVAPAKAPQLTVIHHQSAQPRPQRGALDIRRPALSKVTGRPQLHQQDEDLFENALASATSHQQPQPNESSAKKLRRGARKSSKFLSISAAVAVFVLLAGFIAYQNKANIELQLASAKAGFHVATPLYNPSGFALNKLSYSPGTAALAYNNSKDKESYNLTQKQSNWDSQTLLDNYVATAGDSYQGYQANGRTVYVYGNGNATWVNGGIWYQIHTSSDLSSDQLVKIASSI